MTWVLALAATAAGSAVTGGLLAAMLSAGVAAPVPSGVAVVVGQLACFAAARCLLGAWVRAALARPASASEPAPGRLLVAVGWLAEAAPRWLLGFAALLGLVVAATWPLLFRGLLPAALWGLGLLGVAAFIAAALAPDRAWRLALPSTMSEP